MNARVLLLALALAAAATAQAPSGFILPSAPSAFPATTNAGTDVVCALHADVITGLTCNNAVSDATSATAFSSTVTIPAGALSANNTTVKLLVGGISSGVSGVVSLKLGSTVIYTSGNINGPVTAGAVAEFQCSITAGAAASSTTPVIAACTGLSPSSITRNTLLNGSTKSIAVDTTTAQTLSVTAIFGANTTQNALWLYSISQ